jgi:LPXTG-site transpeptidase (sortase) family protein
MTELARLTYFAFEDDNFGNAIAVHGNWILVGANGRDPRSLNRAGEAFMVQIGGVQLPDTGFAPGKVTQIKNQPLEKAYQGYGELSIEVPSIDVRMSIVGVSRGGNGWDVRWLWDQAGYLDGTAFPTWPGNTGIAAHAVLPNGSDGPFARLDALKWGDQVIIHAWGQKYIYEVRQSMQVYPNETEVLGHDELDWVTLITCQDYDDDLETYRRRMVVRAVLVAIEDG